MARPAVLAIASWEWSRRRRSLLVLGVLAGLFGGLVVAGATLTRRTMTAPDRLFDAVAPGDVHATVFGADGLVEALTGLPGVEHRWIGGVIVGQLSGGPTIQYVGVAAPIVADGPVLRPVVIAGREPDPRAAGEVLITEAIAERSGLEPGDTIELDLLTAAEVSQFDTGFGAPDGPTVAFTVTGVGRVPAGMLDSSPVIATPAFATAHRDLFAGHDMYLALAGGRAAAPGWVDAADRLVDERFGSSDPAAGTDFARLVVDNPRHGTDALLHSSRVLIGGLIAAVVLAAIAVLAALGQAWARHHGSAAADQRVEAALGLPTSQRVLARLIPAAASATVAGAISAAIGLAAVRLQSAGALRRFDPDIGAHLDPWVLSLGVVATIAAVLAVAAATARRAGTSRPMRASDVTGRAWRIVPRRRGWMLAGATFALSARHGRRHIPVRISLAGCIVGVAGIVAASTFGASLDRLVTTPARYGWNADLAIVDIDDDDLAALTADPRFAAVADLVSAEIRLDGSNTALYSSVPVRGVAGWVVSTGRMPDRAGEVVLGARLAKRLGVGVSSSVGIGGSDLRVVGIGLGPPINGEAIGSSALVHPDDLIRIAPAGRFRQALLAVAPGYDLGALVSEYGSEFELSVREMPAAVREVSELGSLPAVLGGFLALLAAVALGHALVVTTRQRARDLAVMRALGAPPRDAGLAVVSMAVATLAVGVVVGAPLGWTIGRLLWGELARSIGVAGDVTTSWVALAGLGAALAAAVVLALVPARSASRVDPGQVLRSG